MNYIVNLKQRGDEMHDIPKLEKVKIIITAMYRLPRIVIASDVAWIEVERYMERETVDLDIMYVSAEELLKYRGVL